MVGSPACPSDRGAEALRLQDGVRLASSLGAVIVAWRESLAGSLSTPCSDLSSCNGLRPLKKATAPRIFEVILMHFLSDPGFTEHLTTWGSPQNRDEGNRQAL